MKLSRRALMSLIEGALKESIESGSISGDRLAGHRTGTKELTEEIKKVAGYMGLQIEIVSEEIDHVSIKVDHWTDDEESFEGDNIFAVDFRIDSNNRVNRFNIQGGRYPSKDSDIGRILEDNIEFNPVVHVYGPTEGDTIQSAGQEIINILIFHFEEYYGESIEDFYQKYGL
jgi:hypothetical protein